MRRVPTTDVRAVCEVMAWQRASWLLSIFHFSKDPRWLLDACEVLRSEGVELPDDWAVAEAWARSRRKRSGAPRTQAERDVRVLSDVLWELCAFRTRTETERGGVRIAWKMGAVRFPDRLPAALCARIAARYGVTPAHLRVIVSRGRREIDPNGRHPPPKKRQARHFY